MKTTASDICVLISDVHFNIKTRFLAKRALTEACRLAVARQVPLVIAGDLNDTKALMRAECINDILEVICAIGTDLRIIVLVGNHDLINEKADDHTLHFLDSFCDVVRAPVFDPAMGVWLIPYFSNVDTLAITLSGIEPGSTIIMHQGVMGAFMGEYVVDKTSLPAEAFADFRVISGHYHRAQDIKCGRPRKGAVGLFTYIGTPYSVTFAEAHDGPKGIAVLKSDGLLERIPLGLRKHVIIETTTELLHDANDNGADPFETPGPDDLVWLKVSGPASELDALTKKRLKEYIGHENFKLDRVYDVAARAQDAVELQKLPTDVLLDKLIDDSEETPAGKVYLKTIWREVF